MCLQLRVIAVDDMSNDLIKPSCPAPPIARHRRLLYTAFNYSVQCTQTRIHAVTTVKPSVNTSTSTSFKIKPSISAEAKPRYGTTVAISLAPQPRVTVSKLRPHGRALASL